MPLNLLCYAVPHNNHYALLLENISLYFILIHSFFLPFFCSFSFHPMPYFTPSFLDVTVGLLPCSVFKKAVYNETSNWLLVLVHSIHCGSAVFPHHAFERRPAQETLIGCVGLHDKQFGGI
jgi:hypothetical protein